MSVCLCVCVYVAGLVSSISRRDTDDTMTREELWKMSLDESGLISWKVPRHLCMRGPLGGFAIPQLGERVYDERGSGGVDRHGHYYISIVGLSTSTCRRRQHIDCIHLDLDPVRSKSNSCRAQGYP